MEETFYAPDPSQHKRRVLLSIGVSILIVILVGGGVWWWKMYKDKADQGPADGGSDISYQKDLPVLSKASLAKLPAGIPRYLILGVTPEIWSSSQKVDANASLINETVNFVVVSDPKVAFNEYLDFFQNTGWNIKSQYMGTSIGSITAERNGKTVVVSFTAGSHSTKVTLSQQSPHLVTQQ